MIALTRRYRFCASHRLHAPALTGEENRELYGKCNNPFGHGHDYALEVSVRGPLDPAGRVVRVAALDRLVHDTVIAPMDHRNLNTDIPAFAAVVPTSENLVREIERLLREEWPSAFHDSAAELAGVRLRETKRNSFETGQ